ANTRAGGCARAVQRSCRHAGIAEMAADVYQPTGRYVSGARRAVRLLAAVRHDEERIGMECAGSGVYGESRSEVGFPMTEAEFKKHLDAAKKSPKEIAAAVVGLSEKVLRYKPSPGKWCVLEVLGHLADIEIVYGYRFRQMLADTKPAIAPIDQDAWVRNLNYMGSPASELIAFYGLGRHHNLRLLRSLKASDFSKSAFHPE